MQIRRSEHKFSNTTSKNNLKMNSKDMTHTVLNPSPYLFIIFIAFISVALGLPNAAFASDIIIIQSSSIGYLKQESSNDASKVLDSNLIDKQSSQNNALSGKTRTESILFKQQEAESNNSAIKNTHETYGFSIYQAMSYLLTDIDEDGYFQQFSIVFDADLHSSSPYDLAEVYAEMYTRKNGGPWIHYFTTESFVIEGESTNDEYEVITRFNQGYIPAEYDVLIDLYEVGYSDVVATFSSNDSNALYALPLESEDYDPEYVEYYSESVGHAGSSSMFALILLLSVMMIRNTSKKGNFLRA